MNNPWLFVNMFDCPNAYDPSNTYVPSFQPTAKPTNTDTSIIKIKLKCPKTAPIVHNKAAGNIIIIIISIIIIINVIISL